ncbi:hypothetical protein [Usitatibacter palustris]|uniref:Uncharacterized protein n=1 Tax=Usitatibacter palustris TaxID=2732487 RepID=A0A6M4H4A4_9PROT|nr:hypothetical protein [Usitatibacter palustris]QJR13543.1 hypothetical protein DSM104440_00327 [Usitatibacter palustris]
MANVARTSKEILEDMTAFAFSSDFFMGKALALRVGECFSFVPRDIADGSPTQQALATTIATPFTVCRIGLDRVPLEYEMTAEDLVGQVAFLVTSATEPERHQLAVIEMESGE